MKSIITIFSATLMMIGLLVYMRINFVISNTQLIFLISFLVIGVVAIYLLNKIEYEGNRGVKHD